MGLQEDLDVLQLTVPTVSEDVAKVLEQSAAYGDAVKALIDDMDGKREAATSLLEMVRRGLSALERSAEAQRSALEQALKGTEAALQEVVTKLGEGRDRVQQQSDAAEQQLKALQTSLAAAGDTAKADQDAADGKLDALVAALGTDQQELGQAVATAKQAADAVEGAIAEGVAKAAEGMKDLAARIDLVEEKVPGHLNDTYERRVVPPADALKEATNDALADVTSRNAQLFSALAEATEPGGAVLVETMEKIDAPASELTEAVAQAQEDVPSDRAAVDTDAQRLKYIREPLPGMVTEAQGSAPHVGYSW